jgi:hypothetical protein
VLKKPLRRKQSQRSSYSSVEGTFKKEKVIKKSQSSVEGTFKKEKVIEKLLD